MAQKTQKNIALKGMDLSLDESYMTDEVARFIKGWTYLLSDNANIKGADIDGGFDIGANKYVFVPNKSNELFSTPINFPPGDNRSIKGGFVPETGKYYSMIWNSNGDHSIWELDGNKRTVKMVLTNKCLNFQYDPKHFISNTRFTYSTYTFTSKKDNTEQIRTIIFFVDGFNRDRQIFVDDAIATKGFTHPFFTSASECCDVCRMISMSIPRPNGCIGISTVSRPDTPEEKAKVNAINYKVWQFRVRYIDAWGREGEHGIISDKYFNSTNNSCGNNEDLYPRCLDLSFDANCPDIVAYDIEFRICGAGNNELSGDSSWRLHDRIYRYAECNNLGVYIPEFWRRKIKTTWLSPVSDTNNAYYDSSTNKITYRFCADKQSTVIPDEETSRLENYLSNCSNSIFKVENKIGVAGTKRRFDPLLCSQLDKIKFGVRKQEDSNCNPFVKRKIVMYGYFYNPIDGVVTNVRKTKESKGVQCISYGRAGGTNGSYTTAKDNNHHYRQAFKIGDNGTDNLVMHLINTNYYAVGVQGTIASGTFVPIGVQDELNTDSHIITRWEFEVPAGIFIGAFSAPEAGLSSGFRNTSANFIGMTKMSNIGGLINEQHEVLIDVRNGDYDSLAQVVPQAALIWDLTSYVSSGAAPNLANALTGYVKANNGTNPSRVETANVSPDPGVPTTILYNCTKTDRNGYYFATTKGTITGNQLRLIIDIASCPGFSIVTDTSNNTKEYIHQDSLDVYAMTGAHTGTFKIKGYIKDCITNKGVPNVSVIYTNGNFINTDVNGYYEIEAHGDYHRVDSLIISNGNNSCIKVNCSPDGCDSTFAPIAIDAPDCSSPREVIVPDVLMTIAENTTTKGLMIGRYGAGVVLEDCLGMQTFVQSNDNCFVDVVDMKNTSVITYDITGLNVPNKFKALSFYVTENLTYSDWMEWDVDYAVLEDSNSMIKDISGVNVTNPTRVRIYIESLLYYTAYKSANTSWQVLKGDIVNIFELSNGASAHIEKLISYREGENYITVDYDDSMKDFITNSTGAKIRLMRPRKSSENDLYYQLCTKVDIVNGDVVPAQSTGDLPYSNVYRLQRAVPIYHNNTYLSPNVVENVYDMNSTVVGSRVVSKYISVPENTNNVRVSRFNHHSPSDFWGDHCWGRGRINTKNIYEKEDHLKTEISISKGISANGNINRLHQFYNEDSHVYNEQQFSSITGVVCSHNIILVICSNDYFTLVYDQTEFRVEEKTNRIISNSSANRLGKPRNKVGNNYGCQIEDINTIIFRNDIVYYLDSQKCVFAANNFNDSKDFTPSSMKGWLSGKVQYHASWNKEVHESGGLKYFHFSIDPNRDELLISSAELHQVDGAYVNQEFSTNIYKNETYAIDLASGILKYSHFFTPEIFGEMETAVLGQQLISFKNGQPWIHYPLPSGTQTYNTYFGIKCKKIYEAVFNFETILDKVMLYNNVYSKEHLLYVQRVVTSSGQLSRIMPKWWVKNDNVWSADFKCQSNGVVDSNLPNQNGSRAILDGEILHGKWAKVRYVSKDDDDNKYCELNGVSCTAYIK